MVRARASGIAIACPNTKELCSFYSAFLDIEPKDEGLVIAKNDKGIVEIWFQEVENYSVPTWPTQVRGQQLHLDIDCEHREAMTWRVIELGTIRMDDQPGETFTVMRDPAGHPFCLCDREHPRKRRWGRKRAAVYPYQKWDGVTPQKCITGPGGYGAPHNHDTGSQQDCRTTLSNSNMSPSLAPP